MIQPEPSSVQATTKEPWKQAIAGLATVKAVGPGRGGDHGPGRPVEPDHCDHQIWPEESVQAA